MLDGTWAFGDLRPLSFDCILADPNWLFELRSELGEEKSAQAQYDCMPTEEIMALPVHQLARGDALLWLWATWPMLFDAKRVIDAWGFRYVTGGAWFKRTTHDKAAFGTGYRFRSACEPFLIGTLGNPLTANNIRNVLETTGDGIYAKTRGHSRKPDDQYQLLDELCPRALRGAELFARQRFEGSIIKWTAWGREVNKFGTGTLLRATDESGRCQEARPTG